MRVGRHRSSGGRTAAATALVAAAAALLATSPLQLRARTEPTGIPVAAPTAGAATVAPAPPPSFSRPAEESRTFVPQSPPTVVEAPSIALRATVSPYTAAEVAANGGAVEPTTLWTVSWWTGGGTPGSHADNTVYLYGHTWREPAVFNRIKELEKGASVFLATRTGRLEYVVEGTFTVAKQALDDHPAVRAARPGRLVLIGCYRETGLEDDTTHNVVVTAQLAGA
ncbi:class F sortase [Knoellia sp. 3-2P3]|uniref:class F sortase n=1 Tax=unclassified Knoellia TaxID=2618719 RepID=UPI0023DA676D|nr:class F sortase [Knoellia sp. 3-2P3]MDF2092986.1 class F sortase [Knoellia sp. 3-2P3]